MKKKSRGSKSRGILKKKRRRSIEDLPSRVVDQPWINAQIVGDSYPEHTSYGGKWLIFVSRKEVDKIWRSITDALCNEELGAIAKVSTAQPKSTVAKTSTHTICVYTYDARDTQDVMRIREALKSIGIVRKIPYKADEATLQGKYKVEGAKNISDKFL
jgi:hypothetical protein